MASPVVDGSGRVSLSFRVGVTGHRHLEHPETVAADVHDAVDRVIALGPGAGDSTTPVELTVVSSLANGTDRIVAKELVDRGARLEVILPFPEAEYRKDFEAEAENAVEAEGSIREFDDLLSKRAHCVVTDSRGSKDNAYYRAGIAVVDRSDVVITVWNGQRAKGHGGTAEIVDYARSVAKPLLWIRPELGHHWTEERFGDDSDEEPRPISLLSPSALQRLHAFNGAAATLPSATSPPFADSSLPSPLHTRFQPFVDFALPFYLRADGQARRNQSRHRRASVALYPIAVAAVLCAALQLMFVASQSGLPLLASRVLAIAESMLLITILLVIIVGSTSRWHEQWLSCRYLAERLRSSVFLAAAGVGEEVHGLRSTGLIADPSDEWVSRAFIEIWSRRPILAVGDADVGSVQRWLAQEWIDGQIGYHHSVVKRASRNELVFRRVSLLFFALGAVFTALHTIELFLSGGHSADLTQLFPDDLLSFVSVALPTIAAGVGAYIAHREFAQLANRSRHMVARLVESRRLLEQADTVMRIRRSAIAIEQLLRGETSDWYALVHLHPLEVPV
ncbi:MAG: DUF4231 domain-containing protein [Candidatus Dormibacteraeota bacterium]|nr:DUF4231 domain-containing protein [Candidatus Dormibacteraeota bacterium]